MPNASRSFRLRSSFPSLPFGPLAFLTLLSACATEPDPDGSGGAGSTTGSGGSPQVIEGPTFDVTAVDAVPSALREAVASAGALDAAGLMSTYPAPSPVALGYDPTSAAGLDLIQASSLALTETELAVLAAQGLVISKRQQFPSFPYGYKTIYGADLPVYVSADSILEAVHRAFDRLLQGTETEVLIAELGQLLSGMRTVLSDTLTDPEVIRDADTYLTVAKSLLEGGLVATSATADMAEVQALFDLAMAGAGARKVELFGVERTEDFSQFEPRGHYTDTPELSAYFKAMMWLGRVDFRLIETQGDGQQVFHRRQFDAAVAMHFLLQGERTRFALIDDTIGAFVGEHDNMTPNDMVGLLSALGVATLAEAAALDDAVIVAEIASGGWGSQRIASRLIEKDPDLDTLPLDRTFALFGQRYTVDSHTFSNTTYDRIPERLLPNPLDAAFVAFGNSAALPLLEPEFENTAYVQALATTRTLVDAHEAEYWQGSVYTRWLGALRALSSLPEGAATPRTSGWQNRVLSTQLGSWAQLRHDTLLYAKQSYTSGVSCEFPDAYVDPYPEFYARIGELAEGIRSVMDSLPASAASLKSVAGQWATDVAHVASNLQTMAENQLSGAEHSQELLDFINEAVNWEEYAGCGDPTFSNFSGWYLRLYLDPNAALEYDPTIADVHTDGYEMRVLHVATGLPRLMVVTANTCSGPRAYAGLAFSYSEKVTANLERLTDEEWAASIEQEGFVDVPWMSTVLAE